MKILFLPREGLGMEEGMEVGGEGGGGGGGEEEEGEVGMAGARLGG